MDIRLMISLLFVLLCGPASLLGQDLISSLDELPDEVKDQAAFDAARAQLLADFYLPESDDLALTRTSGVTTDISWKLPWELPTNYPEYCPVVNMERVEEDEYWDKYGLHIANVMPTEQLVDTMVSDLVKYEEDRRAREEQRRRELEAEAENDPDNSSEPETPPERVDEKRFTRRDALVTLWMRSRETFAPTKARGMEQIADITTGMTSVLIGEVNISKPDDVDWRNRFDAAGIVLADFTDEQLRRQLIDDFSLTFKQTQLVYLYCSDWDQLMRSEKRLQTGELDYEECLKIQAKLTFAELSIRLRAIDPERLGEIEQMDLDEEGAETLQRKLILRDRVMLAALSRSTSQQIARIEKQIQEYDEELEEALGALDSEDSTEREHLIESHKETDKYLNEMLEKLRKDIPSKEQMKKINAQVVMKEYGANSYIVLFDYFDPRNRRGRPGCAGLRNGAAVVDIEIVGNLPKEVADKQLERVLELMEENTEPFTSVRPSMRNASSLSDDESETPIF